MLHFVDFYVGIGQRLVLSGAFSCYSILTLLSVEIHVSDTCLRGLGSITVQRQYFTTAAVLKYFQSQIERVLTSL